MSKTVLLSAAVVSKMLSNQAVLDEFPTLSRFASETSAKKTGCKCGAKSSAVLDKATQYIKKMPQNDRDKLKTLMGIRSDQELITFVRNKDTKLQRVKL